MEFKEVFAGLAVVLVGMIALFGIATQFENDYGFQVISDELNNTRNNIDSLVSADLSSDSLTIAGTTETTSGASEGSSEESALKRAQRTINSVRGLTGLVPAVIRDGASVLGIPNSIVDIAAWIFYISFGLTLAYLLLLGVRSLIPGR